MNLGSIQSVIRQKHAKSIFLKKSGFIRMMFNHNAQENTADNEQYKWENKCPHCFWQIILNRFAQNKIVQDYENDKNTQERNQTYYTRVFIKMLDLYSIT